MSEPQGFFWMKFVGKPNGKLMKGAPGNYVHGKTYKQPYGMSRYPFWQLVEEPAALTVPDASGRDSVFEDMVFVPDEGAAIIEEVPRPTEVAGANVDPDAPAVIEPYMKLNLRTGQMSEATQTVVTPSPPPQEIAVKVPRPEPAAPESPPPKTRDELKAILDERGIKYSTKARTETLAKLVEQLPE